MSNNTITINGRECRTLTTHELYIVKLCESTLRKHLNGINIITDGFNVYPNSNSLNDSITINGKEYDLLQLNDNGYTFIVDEYGDYPNLPLPLAPAAKKENIGISLHRRVYQSLRLNDKLYGLKLKK